MISVSKGQATITRTDWGLTITGTRITLYDVIDYVIAQYPSKLIGDVLNLNQDQVSSALAYIKENRAEVEAEYQAILQEEEEIRKYWESRNQEHFAKIAAISPNPSLEAMRVKLQEQKANHASAV